MRAIVVSLDLLAASALASIGIMLLLTSVRASQSYLLGMAQYQNRSMELITVSQEISVALHSAGGNLSAASSISSQIASAHGLLSRLGAPANFTECNLPLTVCRLVTVSGFTYLMVVSNEGAGES